MANSVMLSSCQVLCSGIYFVPQLLIHIFRLGFRGVMCHLEKPSAAEPAEAAHGARVPCTPLGDGGRVPGVSGVCQATSAAAVRDRRVHACWCGHDLLAVEPQHSMAAGVCARCQDPGDFQELLV